MKKERGGLGKKKAVCDITPLLTFFRCQWSRLQQCSSRIQSLDKKGKPYSLLLQHKSHGDKRNQAHHVYDESNGSSS